MLQPEQIFQPDYTIVENSLEVFLTALQEHQKLYGTDVAYNSLWQAIAKLAPEESSPVRCNLITERILKLAGIEYNVD